MVRVVKLDEDVYQGLAALGKFQETYSDVIRRLYEFYKHHHAEKEIQNKK
jgi:predicted CopG family antitoxin